jgi:hypothetical protein
MPGKVIFIMDQAGARFPVLTAGFACWPSCPGAGSTYQLNRKGKHMAISENIKQGIINTFIVYGVLCAVVWLCVYIGFKIAGSA